MRSAELKLMDFVGLNASLQAESTDVAPEDNCKIVSGERLLKEWRRRWKISVASGNKKLE